MRPEDGKNIYDSIDIPDRLSETVKQAIASQSRQERLERYRREKKKAAKVRFFRCTAAAAAALMACMTVGVNSSEAFAREMGELPVIGALARVLTVRSWHGTDGDYEIDLEVPRIEAEAAQEAQTQPVQDFTEKINEEIEKIDFVVNEVPLAVSKFSGGGSASYLLVNLSQREPTSVSVRCGGDLKRASGRYWIAPGQMLLLKSEKHG